jgi:hypothetical protein
MEDRSAESWTVTEGRMDNKCREEWTPLFHKLATSSRHFVLHS